MSVSWLGGAWVWVLAAAAACTYVFLCAALRNSQRLAMEKRFAFHDRESLSKMTVDEAYTIQTWLASQEFPKTCSAAIFFALFKTYGIPSVSRLLVSTGQFISREGGLKATSRRAADTSILLCNMVVGRPSSGRAAAATARINHLHGAHRRAGRISDDDMLYTLSLFTLEGIRWIDRYEWRRLTDVERCAMATFWKAAGEDLGIGYHRLPSHESGWADGLHWLDELDDWSRGYEVGHMVPCDENARLAEATMGMLLYKLPDRLKPVGMRFASILLGPRLREAMRIPHPPPQYEFIFNWVVDLRKFIVRHLCLPRPYHRRHRHLDETADPVTGRYHVPRWRVHPWYAKPSVRDRIKAWLGTSCQVGNEEFMPQGYLIPEVGPTRQVGMGEGEMRKTVEALKMQDPGRCPFPGAHHAQASDQLS